MAVTVWDWIHEGRAGKWELTRNDCVVKYIRVARIETDTNADDAVVLGAYASCPTIGSAYPTDIGAFCRSVDFSNDRASQRLWFCTVSYSSEYEAATNPLAERAIIEWGTESYRKCFFEDKDGQAIVNSAGSYYDPPVEGDDDRWVVSVSKNVAVVPSWILNYRSAVNLTSFVVDGIVVAARCAKLSAIKIGRDQKRNNVPYRVFSYGLHLNADTWDRKILDAGFEEIDPDDTSKRRKITLNDNKYPTSPWPLDGTGYKLEDPSPTNNVFNTHRLNNALSFNLLPLF